jgi:hypothetical protein
MSPTECEPLQLDFAEMEPARLYDTKFHYQTDLGVIISAFSDEGYSPGGNAARVVDTANSTSLFGSSDLGSPNELCNNAGPGVGIGGLPIILSPDGLNVSNPMANCEGLGNVLIAQATNQKEPIAHPGGSEIVFDLQMPGTVADITLFNVLNDTSIVLVRSIGIETRYIPVIPTGPNGVVKVNIDVDDVEQVRVQFGGDGAVASLGVCLEQVTEAAIDPANDPPVPAATAAPTTESPTMSPQPSTSPSASPSSAPSQEPLPIGDCPADVVLLEQVGVTLYPTIPIVITAQDKTSVTFTVMNSFTENVTRIFTQYHEAPTGETDCFEEESLERGDNMTYHAYCMTHVPISIVDIWVSDDAVLDHKLDHAVVPECCHPPAADVNPKVQYTFKLHCVTQCPDRRLLEVDSSPTDVIKKTEAGSYGSAITQGSAPAGANYPIVDGHFCASEDFPCGETDNMVYACHYSARHGYRTFCVPEPDSDLLGFYPKDYCGPCVGGYGEHSG